MKLRSLYPAKNRDDFERRVTPEYLDQLVSEVTEGFRGDVGVVPRQFLRRLISVLELVDREATFVPEPGKPVLTPSLTVEEESRKVGKPEFEPEPGDEKGYEVMDLG